MAKWYEKAGNQAALIGVFGLIVVAGAQLWHTRSEMFAENKQLRRDNGALQEKIEELNADLSPFKAIALQKYQSSEASALNKLAEHLIKLDEELRQAQENLARLNGRAKQEDLRKVADIYPDGIIRRLEQGVRFGEFSGFKKESSIISSKLDQAFNDINTGHLVVASVQLEQIIKEVPVWPYAYFYLGVFTGNISCFQEAQARFDAFREAGIFEPELQVYEAMNLTYLGDFTKAQIRLDEAQVYITRMEIIPFVSIAKNTPMELAKRFESIAAINEGKVKAKSQN